MILFKVNAIGIAFRPFEGDAPWTVDMQTVTYWLSLQAMKLHPGQIQIPQRARLIQGIQTPQSSRLQIWTHFSTGAGLKKYPQSSVPEALDHPDSVKQRLTHVKG
jgi:hypothetical protein